MARRYKSLHHGEMDGKNVIFHREHRSKKGRLKNHNKKRIRKLIFKETKEKRIERLAKVHIRKLLKGEDLNTITV